MSKRKKPSVASPANETLEDVAENESVTTRSVVPPEIMEQAMGGRRRDGADGADGDDGEGISEGDADAASHEAHESAPESVDQETAEPAPESSGVLVDDDDFDAEMTVNLTGDLPLPGRDDLDAPTVIASGDSLSEVDSVLVQRRHLRGLLEALVFASDSPITPKELAKLASAPQKQVRELLDELKADYDTRGMHLDEVAGGWVFRTSPQYAPFVRDLTKQKPVRLTRAQVETLAIIAYRQPITRPEVDDVRGVDSGPVLKLLLERDLVRILGKRDEPGRPLIYGTTGQFLEFFGLKSLKDLPTLREFTELSDESREAFEDELGESPEDAERQAEQAEAHEAEGGGVGEYEPGEQDDTDADDRGDDGAIGRAVRESMRVLVGDESLEDADADDLEPVDDLEGDAAGEERHEADDDGPTLTSEAPTVDDDDA